MTSDARPASTAAARFSAAIVAFFLFAMAGPLVGLAIFWLLLVLVALLSEPGTAPMMLYASPALLPLAYLVGGVQAAWTGLVTAVAIGCLGRAPLWASLAGALSACTVHVSRVHEDWTMSIVLVVVHLGAALGCWLILHWTDWK